MDNIENIDLDEFLRRHSENVNSCRELSIIQFASDYQKSVVSVKGSSELIVGALFSAIKYRPEVRRMIQAAVESYEEDKKLMEGLPEEERINREIDDYLLNKKVASYLESQGLDISNAPVVDSLAIFWDIKKDAIISIFKGVRDDKFETVTGEVYSNCIKFMTPYSYLSIINEDK